MKERVENQEVYGNNLLSFGISIPMVTICYQKIKIIICLVLPYTLQVKDDKNKNKINAQVIEDGIRAVEQYKKDKLKQQDR